MVQIVNAWLASMQLDLDSSNHIKVGIEISVILGLERGTWVDPWDSQASQAGLLSEMQANGRPCLNKQVR